MDDEDIDRSIRILGISSSAPQEYRATFILSNVTSNVATGEITYPTISVKLIIPPDFFEPNRMQEYKSARIPQKESQTTGHRVSISKYPRRP